MLHCYLSIYLFFFTCYNVILKIGLHDSHVATAQRCMAGTISSLCAMMNVSFVFPSSVIDLHSLYLSCYLTKIITDTRELVTNSTSKETVLSDGGKLGMKNQSISMTRQDGRRLKTWRSVGGFSDSLKIQENILAMNGSLENGKKIFVARSALARRQEERRRHTAGFTKSKDVKPRMPASSVVESGLHL